MSITVARRSIDYILKTCVTGSTTPEQIPYYPQKTRSMMGVTPDRMPRLSSPESVGIPAAHVEDFLHALEKDKGSRMHNLLVYCRGHLISRASAPGYSPLMWSLVHSMSKTITVLALSTLIDEGLLTLDTRLVDIFKGELPTFISPRMQKITIRHLLTMTAGVVKISETAVVTMEDWKRAFFSCTPSYTPGTKFHYNSINSYLLAAVVEKLTGRPLEDVLKERIFDPLEITNYYIEKSAQGIAKGGWGMYITPVDMAKLGLLILNGGKWQGKTIIQKHHMDQALTTITETPLACGDYNYGFHLWVARDGSAALINGMLGQNVWVHFKNQIVVVSTCGNDEFFQQSSTLRLINDYFGNHLKVGKPLLPNLLALGKLRRAEQDFFCDRFMLPLRGQHEDIYSKRRETPLPRKVQDILGTYEVEKNNVGLLPLVLRLMQNNHSPGISRVAFTTEGRALLLHIWEGDEQHTLEGGFNTFRYREVDYKGEKYVVGMCCAFTRNEDGEELLRCEVVFPEIPNQRRIKFYFHDGGGLVMRLSEAPGVDMLYIGLRSLSDTEHFNPYLAGFLEKQMHTTRVTAQILHCLEPVLYAHPTPVEGKKVGNPARDTVLRRRTLDHRTRSKARVQNKS